MKIFNFETHEYFNAIIVSKQNQLEYNNQMCQTKIPLSVDFYDKTHFKDLLLTPTNILQYKYSVQQLKLIAKQYGLITSGNKSQLEKRIYFYLFMSKYVTKIQKIMRGKLQRIYNDSHGPGFFKRNICTNACDFLSMDPLHEIPYSQFFSFRDKDGFIYGFDIVSLYNLLYQSKGDVKNPYNRLVIPQDVISNLRRLLRLSIILNIPTNVDIKDELDDLSIQKKVELNVLSLFQKINALGNYSDPKWFMDLTISQLNKLMRELVDIWMYRAPLTMEVKREICPPLGNPFGSTSFLCIHSMDLDSARSFVINILEKMVTTGINHDSKSLGAFYVLAALTLVSVDAANGIPWLYQSVNYL